jgi:hypothetical protein
VIQKDPQIDDLSSLSVKHDEKYEAMFNFGIILRDIGLQQELKHRVTQPTKQLLNIHYKS